jgi:CTP:molybdopterin cytidylyltransferase MocA
VSRFRVFPVGAVIVGAGAGKRFGGPKAIATLTDGRRFLDAIAQTAQDAGLDPIIAVVPPGVSAPGGVRVVINADPGSEQITSVRLGLAQLTSAPVTGALVWPVDHPFVTIESVLAVLDGARRTDARIAVPLYESRRGHPTYLHRDTWRELMTVGEGGARAVIRSDPRRVCEVRVDDRGVLRGINTRQDLVNASASG